MSAIVVKVQHIREAGLCVRGARMWFAQHDLDFGRFMTEGLPIEELDVIDDALAKLVCMTARNDNG